MRLTKQPKDWLYFLKRMFVAALEQQMIIEQMQVNVEALVGMSSTSRVAIGEEG